MNELWYVFFLCGSFSTGYSLLRTGFPGVQADGRIIKIALGFVLGAAVFGLSAMLVLFAGISAGYFLMVSFIIYALIFAVFLTKRISFKEVDPAIVEKEPERAAVPLKVLTKEEKERRGIEEPKKITFEQGLLVKTTRFAVKPEEIKKQVFKEKDNTILRAIDSKTKEIEAKDSEKQKIDALAKLKELAQGINKKKSDLEKAEESDTIEEDLLSNIGSGKEEQ